MKDFSSESQLTLQEATAIIAGHGIGSGILAVPYLVSRNNWYDFLWIIAVVYLVNLLLHYVIAELSYNNEGAQFIKCFENELLIGKTQKSISLLIFVFVGFSVIMNVSSFIVGSAAVFENWFGLPRTLSMVLYYMLAGCIVFIGMKLVGICEKYAVSLMALVIFILLLATLFFPFHKLPTTRFGANNILALYSTVSFSLSAVMSVPQVVKGLNGQIKPIRRSIALGTGVNALLLLLISYMTLICCGSDITDSGALVDLSHHLGGWVSIVGYAFTLLALSTSFWANTLNLRDIIHEQFSWNLKSCWLISTLPSLIIALVGIQSFVGFVRIAGVIQVMTGIAIIFAYYFSRKRCKSSPICVRFSSIPFLLLIIFSACMASYGAILRIT